MRCTTGLRQAMATFGALLGASIAGICYNLSGQNYILTFALSTLPAVLSLVLVYGVSQDLAQPFLVFNPVSGVHQQPHHLSLPGPPTVVPAPVCGCKPTCAPSKSH